MAEIMNLITQNGIGVVCVAFMIYYINTSLKDNNKILTEIQKTLISIQTSLINLSSRVNDVENKLKKEK